MNRWALATLLLLSVSWAPLAQQPAAATRKVALNGHTFTLPAGFDIELVAGPPLVNRPITADFDEQGRLYAADSSGSNENVDLQLKKKPHRIVRLEDTDGDGKFDKATVFADQMMFPEGTLWYRGSLYVAAPPSIWKLTDTDGDGVADQRVEWFQGKTLTRCANDLHGPYLGPDGMIYWGKGAFAQQSYDRPGKAPFKTRAAHIFRARPDGTGVEAVMTGGMDNPVDVVFTPGGERIFSTTFLQYPGGGNRDGILHAVYGGIYGKDHFDVLNEHKWTSPAVMPVLSHFGAAAPAGLHRYESDAFGPDYKDNLFACQFNMQKVSRHVLTPHGATFKSRDSDFLVSDNKDFHPTDVIEDADGSLLVVDTGGWYKLCCPTSQLVKPDVLGAIYRVRKQEAKRVADPRGLKLAWEKVPVKELAKLLGDARPVVRHRAVQALADRKEQAFAVLAFAAQTGWTGEARCNALWAATRIDSPGARALVRACLSANYGTVVNPYEPEVVRQVALHSVSLWRDRKALPEVLRNLKHHSPQIRRVAAEAAGRIGDKAAVPALLEALEQPEDRFLEHSLIYALIEINDPVGTAAGLKGGDRVRRAALIALNEMESGKLTPQMVAGDLNSTDPALKETAWWIASRHPEWGGALDGILRDRLSAANVPTKAQDELARQLARFAQTAAIQDLLAQTVRDSKSSRPARHIALRAMAQARLRQAPESWVNAIVQALAGTEDRSVREAVSTSGAVAVPKAQTGKLAAALMPVAQDPKRPVDVRIHALAAMPGGLSKVEPALFALLKDHLDSNQAVATRSVAAAVLAKAKLTPEQLIALADALKAIGPMEVNRVLDAYAASANDDVGRRLLAALKAYPGRASLRPGALRPRLAKFGPGVRKEAEAFYVELNADTAKQAAKLEGLLASLKGGDVRRGQAVFNSPKAACASCHAIGYLGGKVGPDLTRIGGIRSERDLLEAIVFPSSSFVRGYEPLMVTTRAGKVYNGVLRQDAPDAVVLATGATEEARIPRQDIDEMVPGTVSVMPSGLDQQLSPRELADLVAFLRACR
jgi:putative membrane-bound dehydrogenase-like protein